VKAYPSEHLRKSFPFGANLFAPPLSCLVKVYFGKFKPIANISETVFVAAKSPSPQAFIVF